MSELDREMLQHLRAYRGETRPSPAQRDGALEGLIHRVRAGDDVVLADEPPAPRIVAMRVRWVVAAASLAALVAGASLVAGERVLHESAPLPSSAAPYDGAVPAPMHEVVEVVEVAPADPPPRHVGRAPEPAMQVPAVMVAPPVIASAPVEGEPRSVAPRRRTSTPAAVALPIVEPVPVVEPSIDAAEVAALRRAQSELSRAPADALARLVDHAAKYPSSSLGAERDVARATALCKLGRADEARALAIAFETRRPDSPLLPRMRRICREPRAVPSRMSGTSSDGSVGSPH